MITNHDAWLNNLFNASDKNIKRVHCPAFYQYLPDETYLNNDNKNDNNIISVHLNKNMDLIKYFHT